MKDSISSAPVSAFVQILPHNCLYPFLERRPLVRLRHHLSRTQLAGHIIVAQHIGVHLISGNAQPAADADAQMRRMLLGGVRNSGVARGTHFDTDGIAVATIGMLILLRPAVPCRIVQRHTLVNRVGCPKKFRGPVGPSPCK